MDSWKKFKKLVPVDKKCYYSELNNSNIHDGDLVHIKKMYVILLE